MARRKLRTVRRYRNNSRSARHKPHDEVHLIPDLFLAGAAAIPFVNPTSNGNPGFLADMLNTSIPISDRVTFGLNALPEATVENLKPIVVMGVLGLVAKWAGKKVGLNKVGSKKVKVM